MCLGYLPGWLAHVTWPWSLGFEARPDPRCHSCKSEEKKRPPHTRVHVQKLCLTQFVSLGCPVKEKILDHVIVCRSVCSYLLSVFDGSRHLTSTSKFPWCGVSLNFQVLQICGELCRRGQRRQQGQAGTFTLGGKRGGKKRQSGCNSYAPDLRRSWTGGSIHLSASKRPAGSARRQDERGVVLDSHRFGLINGALDPRPALQLYLDTVMNWRLGAVYTIFFSPPFLFSAPLQLPMSWSDNSCWKCYVLSLNCGGVFIFLVLLSGQ